MEWAYIPLLPFRNDSDRSGLCSKLRNMRSVHDNAFNPLLHNLSKREYRINSSCRLFLSIHFHYTGNVFICIVIW